VVAVVATVVAAHITIAATSITAESIQTVCGIRQPTITKAITAMIAQNTAINNAPRDAVP
jgi:hypothetical protein